MPSSRAAYRTRQVFHAVWPRISEEDLAYARGLMTQGEWRLFAAMPKRDRRHALEVVQRLRGQTDDRDLLVAGLLHDCGKGDVPVWLRIAHVLVPVFVRRAGDEGDRGWRGAAWRLHRHVELSARLAAEAGCSDVTVRLVGGTHRPEEAPLAALLHAADDAS